MSTLLCILRSRPYLERYNETTMRDNDFPNWQHLILLILIYVGGSILGAVPLFIDAVVNGGLLDNPELLADPESFDMSGAIGRWGFFATGVPLILCIWYSWGQMGKPKWSFGFENVSVGSALLAIAGTLLVANGVAMTAEYLPGYEGFAEMMKDALVPGFGMLLAVVVVAPIFEEMLLRGLIERGFLRKTTPLKAILFSGIIFGVMHLHPVHIFFASLMGFCLGYVYYRTRSLGLVILIHFINNAVSYYFGQQELPDSSEELLGTGPLGVFSLAFLLTALGVNLLWYMGKSYPLAPVPPEDREPDSVLNDELAEA